MHIAHIKQKYTKFNRKAKQVQTVCVFHDSLIKD